MSVETTAPPGDLVLDPFSYVSDMASKIGGLGGQDRPPEGDYAFHTPYVPVAEGIAHFRVHFGGLRATTGTLNLRVHMLSGNDPHARLATAERVALNRLVALNGFYELRFEAFHGVVYALYGGIIGDTDAEASGLQVILDRPADPNEQRESAAEARNTLFGGGAVATPHLVSVAKPSLVAPVTQLATQAQLREIETRRWFRSADCRAEGAPLDRWRSAYLLQTIEAYGFLQPGARGGGLDCRQEDVFTTLAARGCKVDAIVPPGHEAAGKFGAAMRAASLDPLAPDVVNYDFVWTDALCSRFGTAAAAARFIETAMLTLRPGGLAVHVVEYDPADESSNAFRRGDVERVCLILISRGHEVAEFRIEGTKLITGTDGLSACGIVCRKAVLSAG